MSVTPTDSADDHGWVISCELCERSLTMRTFPAKQDAIVHAVTNGWTLNDTQTMCPGCAAASTLSTDPPMR